MGTTHVTLTAHDAAGNTASTSFDVAVLDGTAPTISGTFSPLTLVTGAGGTVALPDYTGLAVTGDNVGVTIVTQSPAAGSVRSVGTTHVTLTAHDAAGNAASTSFDVTVNDSTPPVVTCSTNIMVTAAPTSSSAVVNFIVTATDNVAVAMTNCVPPSGSAFPVGVTTVNCTATDTSGNSNTCTFTVTVQDTTAPVVAITAPTSDSTFATTSGSTTLSGIATDNVGVTQVTWVNDRGGSGTAIGTNVWSASTIALQLGANVITVAATDVGGNNSSTSLTVTRQMASGAVYYVATNGNNSNNGTSPATPFLTIQKGLEARVPRWHLGIQFTSGAGRIANGWNSTGTPTWGERRGTTLTSSPIPERRPSSKVPRS